MVSPGGWGGKKRLSFLAKVIGDTFRTDNKRPQMERTMFPIGAMELLGLSWQGMVNPQHCWRLPKTCAGSCMQDMPRTFLMCWSITNCFAKVHKENNSASFLRRLEVVGLFSTGSAKCSGAPSESDSNLQSPSLPPSLPATGGHMLDAFRQNCSIHLLCNVHYRVSKHLFRMLIPRRGWEP